MRVDNHNVQNAEAAQASQTQQAKDRQRAESTSENSSSQKGEGDAKTTISGRARELAMAKSVAQSAPDVRAAKIAELRRRIENREYNVKPEAIAEKMIKEHKEL